MALVSDTSKSRVARVQAAAASVVEDGGFSDPHRAMGSCGEATRILQCRLEPLWSYRFETRVERLPADCPWKEEGDGPEVSFAWHMMLAVPGVGIADTTGSQFLCDVPRVLTVVPEWWDGLVGIRPSEKAPEPSALHPCLERDPEVEVSKGLAVLLWGGSAGKDVHTEGGKGWQGSVEVTGPRVGGNV